MSASLSERWSAIDVFHRLDGSPRNASTDRGDRRVPSGASRSHTRSSWGEMPLPSITTTTLGHGGGVAGTGEERDGDVGHVGAS